MFHFFKSKHKEKIEEEIIVPKKISYNIGFYQDELSEYFYLKELNDSVSDIAIINYNRRKEEYIVRNIGKPNERLIVCVGDIGKIQCDCVVNAARPSLLGGGGVDGAIHAAAGPELVEECKTLGGCDYGEAKITNAYNMRCKKIIHTVGPVWHGGDKNEAELLKSAYTNSLKLAVENNLKTIAIPAISTGAYGYPLEDATKIELEVVMEFLDKYEDLIIVLIGNNSLFHLLQKEFCYN